MKETISTFFAPAKDFTLADFKKNFRVITDENKEDFAKLMDYESYAAWEYASQVGVLGMILDCTDPYEGDTLPNVAQCVNASKSLLASPQNISSDMPYEDAQIFWCLYDHDQPRVFSHSIIEYMEPEGEGNTQFDADDFQRVTAMLGTIEGISH